MGKVNVAETTAIAISKYKIEFTSDDEIMILLDANTHAKYKRNPQTALRCLTLIAGGSPMRTSCKLSGVPISTLNAWRRKEWYTRVITLIQAQLDQQLDGRLTHGLNSAIDKTITRLEVGDPIVTKDGVIGYKPVTAKDSAIVGNILFDKRALLRNKPTSITSKQTSDERLDGLATKFKEIAIQADYEVIDEDREDN